MAEDEVTRKPARHTVSPRERKNILKIGPNLAATFVAALTIALPAAAQDTGTRIFTYALDFYGGRNRTRTCDPLIKSRAVIL